MVVDHLEDRPALGLRESRHGFVPRGFVPRRVAHRKDHVVLQESLGRITDRGGFLDQPGAYRGVLQPVHPLRERQRGELGPRRGETERMEGRVETEEQAESTPVHLRVRPDPRLHHFLHVGESATPAIGVGVRLVDLEDHRSAGLLGNAAHHGELPAEPGGGTADPPLGTHSTVPRPAVAMAATMPTARFLPRTCPATGTPLFGPVPLEAVGGEADRAGLDRLADELGHGGLVRRGGGLVDRPLDRP